MYMYMYIYMCITRFWSGEELNVYDKHTHMHSHRLRPSRGVSMQSSPLPGHHHTAVSLGPGGHASTRG